MSSIDRIRHRARGALALVSMLVLIGGVPVSAANPPTVVLQAAAAQGQSGIEVRLRWSLTDGWLPDGGFNLYRSDRTAPLNPAPLGSTTSITSAARIDIGASKPFELGKLLTNARQMPSSTTLPPLAVTLPQPPSSDATFDRLATQSLQTTTTGSATTGSPATTTSTVAPVSPILAAHPAPVLTTTPPTLDEATFAARKTLVLGAALHRNIGNALGLSFDDATVTPGQTYTYTLRAISNGTETAVLATATLTVPTETSELKPAPPAGLRAVQTGPETVALRWKRLDAKTESAMGIAKYDVYRTTEMGKRQKLNSVPIMVVNVGTPGVLGAVNNLHEPQTFFTDTAPVVGRVKYELVVTDIFDRSSDSATVTVAVADLHKPRPVPFVGAQLQAVPALASSKTYRRTEPFHISVKTPPGQAVLIAWQASPDSGVAYRIYREDTEHVGTAPELLNPNPVSGTATAATALPAGTIREVLATQECSSLAHAGTLASLFAAVSVPLYPGQTGSVPKQSTNNVSCDLSQLSATQRTAVEQTLLSSIQLATWTDSTAQKDHYYRYLVAAVFTRNSQPATPANSNVVAYPDLTPPASPTSPAATFQANTSSQTTGGQSASTASGGNIQVGDGGRHPLPGNLVPLTLTNWSGALLKAPPRDTGGTMVLKWQPSPDAAKYEVYRANVTRITTPQRAPGGSASNACKSPSSQPQQQGGTQSGAATSQPSAGPAVATVAGHSVMVGMPVCIGTPVLASLTWQVPPNDSDFVLLGTSTTTEYDDALSRSSAHYYQYRIVPVNRWNVPGAMATIDARAPATQPPTAPKILVGAPSPDGGAQIEFLPDGDPGEEVVRYELWRSTIGMGLDAQSGPPSGPASTSSPATSAKLATTQFGQSNAPTSGSTAVQAYGLPASQAGTTPIATTMPRIAQGPTTAQLAGTAARYGLTLHQPVMAAAARNGTSISAVLQASLVQGNTVTQINSSDLPAGSNNGAWLTDQPTGLDWRKDYVYAVKAVDRDGLVSTSEPVDVTPLKVKAVPPANVVATWNLRECAVDLSWQSADPDTARFVVERQLLTPSGSAAAASTSGQTPVQIAQSLSVSGTLVSQLTNPVTMQATAPDFVQLPELSMTKRYQAPSTRYVDFSIFPDNSYLYQVRAVDKAGNISAPTAIGQGIDIPDGCGSAASPVPSGTTAQKTQVPVAPPLAVPQTPTDTALASQTLMFSAGTDKGEIPVNGVTTLTFRLQNTSGSPFNQLALSSRLPAGLVVALPNALTNTCGGTATATPWTNSIAVTGGTLPPNGSCTVTVKVAATTAGAKQVNAVVNQSGRSSLGSASVIVNVLQGPANPRSPTPSQPKPEQRPAISRAIAGVRGLLNGLAG